MQMYFLNDCSIEEIKKALVIALICLCIVTALWFCITLYYCAKSRKNTTKKTESKAVGTVEEITVGPADEITVEEVGSKKKLSFQIDSSKNPRKSECRECRICTGNTKQYGPKGSPKRCPKCKRKHCRCVKNIWSTLSNCSITYPRIFSRKNTATSGLLQKHVEFKADEQTTAVTLCPQCKIPACKHLTTFSDESEHFSRPQNNFMVEMASVKPKGPSRNIQSAPATSGRNIWQSENTSKSTYESKKAETKEKVFVFGYDFETSSDDSSSTDDSSSDTS